ncbi:S-layer family protein [Nostoc sp. FACHB-280]|uniref:two-partner secretion domain-containing protein n=1 Tax=Nostoc sp. FACHB-280 TaxID=2692839 RepID=UPI00168BFF81|nr:S-layer family protein [Nostoc sp. FACHB-280]MBD2497915.1 S-layer family protein [Nostoc sp. FACHB-280]
MRNNYWLQILGITLSSTTVFWSNCLLAQIIPDATLPINSRVSTVDNATTIINGGTPAGSNLFHSFQEFSVPTNSTATFNNAANVQNIITRVTGSSVSQIDGLIRANGTANLFLINPQGIIFQPHAKLNIGGSFLATTANSLKFADGREFRAKVNQITPLLSISIPIGLQFASKTGQIQVNGIGGIDLDTDRSIDSNLGLQVLPGKSLIFVGGNVSLDGGILQAPGGRVELGGLAAPGIVGLNFDNNLQLSFPVDVARADISLTNASTINVVAENSGSIAVNAHNLDLFRKSTLVAGIGTELGEVGSQAGDITLNATGAVKFEERSQIFNSVNTNAIGDGGNITIQGESVLFNNVSTLWSVTNGRGNAGNVTLKAKDSVTFENSSGTFAFVGGDGIGNGANIIILAHSSSLLNGSQFFSASIGEGNAGNVTFDVSGPVTFAGVDIENLPSGVFTNKVSSNIGKSGDITIRASSFTLRDGAQIDTSVSGFQSAGDITIETSGSVSLTGVNSTGSVSFIRSQVNGGTGSGGNITIKASSLSLQGGAQINSNTLAQGNAGNIKLEISGNVSLAGVDKNGDAGGIFSSVESEATGLGGDINIQANSLFVGDGARLFASTLGQNNAGNITVNVRDAIAFDSMNSISPSGAFTSVEPNAVGDAGNINLTARSIRLDNQAAISAITTSGNGGDINLQVQDILLLRRNSKISTSAGTARQGGDGGNITINAPNGFIVTIPNENSDITANAFTGNGGRVNIQAFGIFDIQPRESSTVFNDITASSELGVDGTIELNTPNVDPNQGLVELPANLVDASEQITQGCTPRRGRSNSFVVTGRGGVPLSPSEPLRQRAVITQWVTLDEATQNKPDIIAKPTKVVEHQQPIVPAQGWVMDKQGNVHLVAQALDGLIQDSGVRSKNRFCQTGI